MKARIAVMFGALALLANAPLNAQGHGAHGSGPLHLTLADGWHARLDRAADAGPEFTTMPPGWHVTSGPASILYDPATTARGDYRVESKIFLFDPGERREGFGIFIGGQNLDSDSQRYTYFLLRRDGRFMIKQRDGADTRVVQDWTESAAVRSWENRGEGAVTAENDLAVEVLGDEVVFSVNGQELARLPRSGLDTEGVVGLRVNHGLNLHVGSLEVTAR